MRRIPHWSCEDALQLIAAGGDLICVRRTHNPLVQGSNPCGPTICFQTVSRFARMSGHITVPDSVPCRLQNRLDRRLFERLNRGLFCFGADVAVAFKHLPRDVPGKRLDRLFADARILRQSRNERVTHIVRPVAHASGFTGEPPCFAPRTHWAAQIHVVQDWNARIAGDRSLCRNGREPAALRGRYRRFRRPRHRVKRLRLNRRSPPLPSSPAGFHRRVAAARSRTRTLVPKSH